LTESSNHDLGVLLHEWWARIEINGVAHYRSALYFGRINILILGVPTVILTAVVGTGAFTSLIEAQVSPVWRVFAGLLSILATVLAALQTFLNLPQRVASHRRSSAEFGSIRRDIEELQVKLEASSLDAAQANDALSKIKERIEKAQAGSPDVPSSVWKQVSKDVKNSKSIIEQYDEDTRNPTSVTEGRDQQRN
jgi:hypothetical protein